MLKSMLIIFVISFGTALNVLADSPPAPTTWAENNIDDDGFYKNTRLECIRKSIQDTVGITPSAKHLSSIALKVRSDITSNNKRELLSQVDGDNHEYRFPYLLTVASYISAQGVCSFDEKNETGVDGFEFGQTANVATFIASNRSELVIKSRGSEPIVLNNQTVSKMISGKEYSFFEKLYPRTKDFRLLSYKLQKELAEKGIAYAEKEYTPFIETPLNEPNSFKNCITAMRKYQKNGGIVSQKIEDNGRLIKPQELCNKMLNACGYPRTEVCKKYDPEIRSESERAAPQRETEKPASR